MNEFYEEINYALGHVQSDIERRGSMFPTTPVSDRDLLGIVLDLSLLRRKLFGFSSLSRMIFALRWHWKVARFGRKKYAQMLRKACIDTISTTKLEEKECA